MTTDLVHSGGGGAALATQDAQGNRSIMQTTETQALATSARVEAMVKAKYTRAMMFPRNVDQIRLNMLALAKDTDFAKAARYALPRGGKTIEGWTVRFAEEAVNQLGNIELIPTIVADTPEKIFIHYELIDLEKNNSLHDEIVVEKTVERLDPKGYEVLSSRLNSQGKTTYRCIVTVDDMRQKINAEKSRARRTLGLQVFPPGLKSEILAVIETTRRAAAEADIKNDPSAARKKLVDAFAEQGVRPTDLAEYLGGRPLDALTPDLLIELRCIYEGIRDRAGRWSEYLESSPHRTRAAGEEGPEAESVAAKVRADLDKRTAAKIENERQRGAYLRVCDEIGEELQVATATVDGVIKLVKQGKANAEIVQRLQLQDATIVSDVIAAAKREGLLVEKAPESPRPATAPAAAPVPPAAETKPEAKGGKRGAGKVDTKFAAIAQQENVPVELVAELAKYAGGDDPDSTIVGVLKLAGFNVDEPTVGIVRAALRK